MNIEHPPFDKRTIFLLVAGATIDWTMQHCYELPPIFMWNELMHEKLMLIDDAIAAR
jgi:hypothetical protein